MDGGLPHPNWNQNLKFAIKVQEKAEELYPGLFKPIMLTKSRYNQHTGKYANIIGNVCMDNFMVDVTNIENIKIGDEVILWDNENITVEEVAKECDTINYEILCNISKRIPRKYV